MPLLSSTPTAALLVNATAIADADTVIDYTTITLATFSFLVPSSSPRAARRARGTSIAPATAPRRRSPRPASSSSTPPSSSRRGSSRARRRHCTSRRAVVGLVAVVAVGHFLATALADGTRRRRRRRARAVGALHAGAPPSAAPYASTAAGMSVAFSSSSAAAARRRAAGVTLARLTALLRLFAVATLAAQFAVASGDSPPTASLISIAQWIDLRSVATLRLALLCAGVAVASRLGAQYDAFAMLQIAGDGAAGGRAAHRWWLLPRWGLGAYEAPAVIGWQLAVGVVLALAPPTMPLVDDGGDGPTSLPSASRARYRRPLPPPPHPHPPAARRSY